MNLKKLPLLLLIFSAAAFAGFHSKNINMAMGSFYNGDVMEAENKVELHISGEFNNTGVIRAPHILIISPAITSENDPKLGSICWSEDFMLNGEEVTQHYAGC